jgi:hypothetical protein
VIQLAYSLKLIAREPRPTFLVELSETVSPELPRIEDLELLREAAELSTPTFWTLQRELSPLQRHRTSADRPHSLKGLRV